MANENASEVAFLCATLFLRCYIDFVSTEPHRVMLRERQLLRSSQEDIPRKKKPTGGSVSTQASILFITTF